MAFRMSSVQFMTNYQSSLNKTYQKQAKLLEKGDGSSIHRGSDDPIGYSKLVRYKVSNYENEQYKSDVDTAQAWMNTTDGAISHIAEITKTFKEKTVAAANSYNTDSDFDAIAKEMYSLIQEMVATGNIQHGDRYVFSGQQDQTKPFELSDESSLRAVTRTLDQAQAGFFANATSNDASLVYQLVSVQDSKGNEFYLDTKQGRLYRRGLVDLDYIDNGYNGKNYQELITMGCNSVDDISKDDWEKYGIYDVSKYESVDSDTATSAITNLFDSIAGETDAKVAADGVKNILNDFVNSVKYGFEDYDTTTLVSLINYTSFDNSDTIITDALNNAGITTDSTVITAFQSFISDNQETLNSYKASSSYYFDKYGRLLDEDEPVSLYVNGDSLTSDYTVQTELRKIVYYYGDDNYISMVKTNGATDTAADIVNATGKDLYGHDVFDNGTSGQSVASGSALINDMITVYEHVKAGDVKWLHHDGVLIADAANANVTNSQTTTGSRLQLYNNVEDMLDRMSDNITEQITDVSGTDVARLATNLMEMTTLYNMALSLGGRVLPQSLADYL